VRRYVENGDEEEIIDVKTAWKELKEIEKERDKADKKVEKYLKELKY
jgi:type I restriction-modification system DNA methylase subunit